MAGTGKTSLARRAAIDSGAKLFIVNGPELVSEFYGASEAALRDVFRAAREAGRAVVLLDEVHTLAPASSSPVFDLCSLVFNLYNPVFTHSFTRI